MARRVGSDNSGAELRQHLLAEAIELRDLVCGPGREPIDGRPPATFEPEVADVLRCELDKPVQALANGLAWSIRRNDLPDWHGERFSGDVNDEFILTENDEVIEA